MGGGSTGLSLGCELRLAGVETIVLERLSQPTGLSKPWTPGSDDRDAGSPERFSRGTVAPPFLNFGMFQLDLRALGFDKLNLVF